MTTVTVLMYHAVLRRSSPICKADPHYSIMRSAFIQHLELIYSHGCLIRSVNEWLTEQKIGGTNAVALTFDDGHISNYRFVN
jgi:hypothetical protein